MFFEVSAASEWRILDIESWEYRKLKYHHCLQDKINVNLENGRIRI
jgi:hypothetical protein